MPHIVFLHYFKTDVQFHMIYGNAARWHWVSRLFGNDSATRYLFNSWLRLLLVPGSRETQFIHALLRVAPVGLSIRRTFSTNDQRDMRGCIFQRQMILLSICEHCCSCCKLYERFNWGEAVHVNPGHVEKVTIDQFAFSSQAAIVLG